MRKIFMTAKPGKFVGTWLIYLQVSGRDLFYEKYVNDPNVRILGKYESKRIFAQAEAFFITDATLEYFKLQSDIVLTFTAGYKEKKPKPQQTKLFGEGAG